MKNNQQADTTLTILKLIEKIPDPRINRCKLYSLSSIIFIALVTTLSGADDWVEIADMGSTLEDWFKRYISLPNGVPSHDTFGRVFSVIDPKEFNKLLIGWADCVRQRFDKEIIAFDGKTLCGTKNRNAGLAGLHLLNAWSVDNEISIGQLAVDSKTNEIKVTPELIKILDLEGCIITADALNTQKNIATAVIEAKADYILPVKGNHKDLQEEIKLMFNDAESRDYQGVDADNQTTTDLDHGRFETREYFLLDAEDLSNSNDWTGIKSVGKVIRTRTTSEKTTKEEVYFITSLEMNISLFARGVRGHWGVENGLHWSLDVIFKEDANRYRERIGAENLGAIRKMALGMLKQDKNSKTGIKPRRLKAATSEKYRMAIIKNYL